MWRGWRPVGTGGLTDLGFLASGKESFFECFFGVVSECEKGDPRGVQGSRFGAFLDTFRVAFAVPHFSIDF